MSSSAGIKRIFCRTYLKYLATFVFVISLFYFACNYYYNLFDGNRKLISYLKGTVNLADIDFIESMKNYMIIHRGSQKALVYTSMKELESHLPRKQFIRVHKSFIIPFSRISGIEGNFVRLKNVTAEIGIGESYKAELIEIIKRKMIQ